MAREPWKGQPKLRTCKAVVQVNGCPTMFLCGREAIGFVDVTVTETTIPSTNERIPGCVYNVAMCDVHMRLHDIVQKDIERQMAAAKARETQNRVALPVDAMGRPLETPDQTRARQAIEIARR